MARHDALTGVTLQHEKTLAEPDTETLTKCLPGRGHPRLSSKHFESALSRLGYANCGRSYFFSVSLERSYVHAAWKSRDLD